MSEKPWAKLNRIEGYWRFYVWWYFNWETASLTETHKYLKA